MESDHVRAHRTAFAKATATAAFVGALALSAAWLMGGCAPQQSQANASDEKEGGSAITVAWTPDMECSSCHAQQVQSESDSACLASKHEASSCESCHGSADNLASAHEGASADATMPKKLSKDNAVGEDACLSCHGTWEDLAAKSAEVTVLTDADGTVVNPHAMDRTGDHAVITCTSCHSVHEAQADQKELCLSCHHEDVFECRTCHE